MEIFTEPQIQPQWNLVNETDSPPGEPVWLWSDEWVDHDFNPTGVREGNFIEGVGYVSCGWDPCNDVFTTDSDSLPVMWARKIRLAVK
jgi:hypothetical protein